MHVVFCFIKTEALYQIFNSQVINWFIALKVMVS
jgi:hypothetical protein